MASARTTVLLLLPPVSVLLCMAVLCLSRVVARKLTALAKFLCPPSPSSFRYLLSVEQDEHHHHGLPVARYRRMKQEEEERCVFCLSGIEEDEEVRDLKCRHLFHRACLDRWLLARRPLLATCPLCRARLLPPPPWEVGMDYYEFEEAVGEEEDDYMMLFMACVHSRSSWLWPS